MLVIWAVRPFLICQKSDYKTKFAIFSSKRNKIETWLNMMQISIRNKSYEVRKKAKKNNVSYSTVNTLGKQYFLKVKVP